MIVTSISPKHSNSQNQHEAVSSWQPLGDCYSLNNAHEIEILKSENYQGIQFVETSRTIEYFVGKPLVTINAMIDFAISKDESLLIINSDIILSDLPPLKQDGITIFSRFDYTNSFEESKIFSAGFDVMYVPKQFLKTFPPSIFALGAAWWDMWLPYHALLGNIPLYYPSGKYAFHKLHPVQYPQSEWLYIAEYFKLEFKMNKNLTGGQAATISINRIKEYLTHL